MGMKNKPKVSIIMSEYNTPKSNLRGSISSMLNQTFSDFEFIIIDDCGTTDVAAIVNEFADKRVRVIKNHRNRGLVYSLNKAVECSEGEYLVRMDTDDISDLNRIETLLDFIENNPEYSVVGTRAMQFSEDGDEGILGKAGEKTIDSIANNDTIIHASAIMRKSDIVAVGQYPDFDRAEDLALWCELLISKYRLYTIDRVMYRYRVNKSDYGKRKLSSRAGEIKARLYYYPRMRVKSRGYLTILKSIVAGVLPVRLVRLYRQKFVLGKIQNDEKSVKKAVSGDDQ